MKELIEKMQKLNVKSIMLDNGCGEVYLEQDHLVYNGGWRVYRSISLAFEVALSKLTANEKKLEKWQEIATRKFSTNVILHNADDSESKSTSWCWKSDITDSGVSVSKDCIVEGTINQLRKFDAYANNHMRYCNGSYYKYDNAELVGWMEIFREFGLYKRYNSFNEYYHNSIVD